MRFWRFFGAPIAHEDDPQRAILAGLKILRAIGPLREEIADTWGVDINVRVGINTGLVVVGAVGSDLRMEYTALGDAINLAARMEQTADPGTVQITEETYRLVAPMFEVEEVGPLEIKGKQDPVQAYRILGRKQDPGRLRGLEGIEAPIIGRRLEIETLGQIHAELEQGIGGIIGLYGEAGFGKSRLIQEWKQAVQAESPETSWLETSALSYETSQPYAVFQRLIRRASGIQPEDSPEDIQARFRQFVDRTDTEHREELQVVLDSLFGLKTSQAAPALEGESFKGRLFLAMETIWKQMTDYGPTVLILDDLHWVDQASSDLIKTLLNLTQKQPFLVVCAMRPDRDSTGWQLRNHIEERLHHRYTSVNLKALTPAETHQLIDHLLPIEDAPDELYENIYEKARGNPFII